METLKFIAAHVEAEGYPPTRTAVGKALGGIARQNAKRLVDGLLADGYLVSARGRGGISMSKKGLDLIRGLAGVSA